MKKKLEFLLLFLLFDSTTAWGQSWPQTWLNPYLHIDTVTLHIEMPNSEIPTIIIDTNGTTLWANIDVHFEVEDYIDSTREIVISDFIFGGINFLDSTKKEMVFNSFLYPEKYGLPLPDGINNTKRNIIYDNLETTFREEKKRWVITSPSQWSMDDIDNNPIWCCGGTIRCWIIL